MLRKSLRIALAVASLGAVTGIIPGAEAPDWAQTLTTPDPGKHPKIEPIQLHYDLTWKGMVDAGNLTFTFGEKPADGSNTFVAKVSGGSTGLAKTLFPYHITMLSQMNPDTLRPFSFQVIENDDEENVTTKTRFSDTTVTSDVSTYSSKKKKTTTKTRTFAFMPTLDALSAMMHTRSQPLNNGDTLRYAFFPTSKPYLITIKVQGHEQFQNRNAIKLGVTMQKIDDDLSLKSYKKLTQATLWLSDDAQRIPLELRAAVFIGDVRMTLTKANPL